MASALNPQGRLWHRCDLPAPGGSGWQAGCTEPEGLSGLIREVCARAGASADTILRIALEGANVRFDMRGSIGAIDHVTWENGKPKVHVIGETKATGICGSGLIDAVAVMLKNGIINQRGRIQSVETQFEGDRAFFLTEDICLTQNDIRQVKLAKGAIAAEYRTDRDPCGSAGRSLWQLH